MASRLTRDCSSWKDIKLSEEEITPDWQTDGIQEEGRRSDIAKSNKLIKKEISSLVTVNQKNEATHLNKARNRVLLGSSMF